MEPIKPGTIMTGKPLNELLKNDIETNIKNVENKLRDFEPSSLYHSWRNFVWAIDDLINYQYELSESEISCILSVNCCLTNFFFPNSQQLEAERIIDTKFGTPAKQRFRSLLKMFSPLCHVYSNGVTPSPMCLQSVRDILQYCEERRLYFVSYLSFIPLFAAGSTVIPNSELAIEILPTIDFVNTRITGAFNSMLLNSCISGITATTTVEGFYLNRDYDPLDERSLEPQRMSIVDQFLFSDIIETRNLKTTKTYTLYSIAQLENAVYDLSEYYSKYNISGKLWFKELQSLAELVKPYCQDDYNVIIPEVDFQKIQNSLHKIVIWKNYNEYFEIINSRLPFSKFGDTYYSTVLLIERYVYNSTIDCLERTCQSYRVDSGFLFETKVSSILSENGYIDQEITRINRNEFDVVTIKGETIYNFQCKNNYYASFRPDLGNFQKIKNRNKWLDNYYKKAIQKEINREQVLKNRLKKDSIKHFVVCRVPIITDNEKVISFNNLEQIASKL